MRTLTKRQADNELGEVIFITEYFVVRARIKNNDLQIFVHQNKKGTEQLPFGYLSGVNYLFVEKREE